MLRVRLRSLGVGGGAAFDLRASCQAINPAYATSPCRWCPEPGCHQQEVCRGQQKFARTDKPASSQTAALSSLCGSLAGSTRTG